MSLSTPAPPVKAPNTFGDISAGRRGQGDYTPPLQSPPPLVRDGLPGGGGQIARGGGGCTNHRAPRTRERHQQEHRPQRPTESSDPTQHAKGRTGDCPGPRKETTTRRNVTRGGGGADTNLTAIPLATQHATGWEVRPHAATFMQTVPADLKDRVHFFHRPISSEANHTDNPVRFVKQLYTPGDFVVFKLDVDHQALGVCTCVAGLCTVRP